MSNDQQTITPLICQWTCRLVSTASRYIAHIKRRCCTSHTTGGLAVGDQPTGRGFSTVKPLPMWGEQCVPKRGCSVTRARCSTSSAVSSRQRPAHGPMPPNVQVRASDSQWILTCHTHTRPSPQGFLFRCLY